MKRITRYISKALLVLGGMILLGQNIYIIPEEETIIVHCGNSLEYYNADVLRSVSERINQYEN